MLVSLISYSQSYPIAKTIGKDSVVIITTKQAEIINNSHTLLKDSIDGLSTLNLMKDLRSAQQSLFYEGLYKELNRKNTILEDRDNEIALLKRKINRTIFQSTILVVGWTIYTGIKSRNFILIKGKL
jgi:hypothetical protein